MGVNQWTVISFQIIAESDKAKETLRDLEARHSELKTLEQSVTQVRDLFADLALMVDIQVRPEFVVRLLRVDFTSSEQLSVTQFLWQTGAHAREKLSKGARVDWNTEQSNSLAHY